MKNTWPFIRVFLKCVFWKPKLRHFVVVVACLLITIRTHKVIDSFSVSVPFISIGPDAIAETSSPPSSPAVDSPSTVAPSASDKKEEKPTPSSETQLDFDPLTLDENQVKVLKAISSQRDKDKSNTSDSEKQKQLVELSEKKLSERISELEKLKTTLDEKKNALTKEEQENVNHLVKIYEGMPPKSAAQIFNKLDLTVLVQLVKHMNQRKVSSILTSMDAAKTQALTIAMLQPVTPLQNSSAPAPVHQGPTQPSSK